MSILANFSVKNIKNFWDIYPEFLSVNLFRSEVYNRDKTKSKEDSSLIMWAIAHLLERENNRWINYPEEERKELIYDNILSDYKFQAKFSWDKYEEVIEEWKEQMLTELDRELFVIRAKLNERTNLLKDNPYTLQNADDLDKLIINSSKLENRLKELEDKIKQMKVESGRVDGDRKESAMERGLF